MAHTQCTGISATIYFALCFGLFIMTTYTKANVINGEDNEFANENAKDWYAISLRSEPQLRFEHGSRSHGKPTFIRFGKRDYDAFST
ncbi:hypothetical protein ACH3XW_22405 [Acanthocheilonema viteae]